MENEMVSTPPALATVGLHRNRGVTETRNRRFKGPKNLVASSTVDELFVSRPQFKKKNLANGQDIKEKGEDKRVTNELDGSSSAPINTRKINLDDDQKMEEKGDENWVTHDLKVLKSTTIDPSFRKKNLEDDQEMEKETDDLNTPSDLVDSRLKHFLTSDLAIRWIWHEFDDLHNFSDLSGAYDMGSFMKEYFPQFQTRFMPRRGWQLLRRSLGKARRFSPAFIELELKVMGFSPRCKPLLQNPNFLEQTPHSSKLIKAIMLVKKLLANKKKVLLEISLKNKEIEDDKDSKPWSNFQLRETKAMYQRCFTNLYRVNDDIVAPMTVLHEHLEQYRKKMEEEKAWAPTALEIYDKCLKRATLDLQLAERNKSLSLNTNRDFVHSLQTIMYVSGELGGPNSADLLLILDSLFSNLSKRVPSPLNAQLKQTMEELEPYRNRMKDLFKNVSKEEPTEDVQ